MGKVIWKDLEVLKVLKKFVEGHGWMTEEDYQTLMYSGKVCGPSLFTKIRAYLVHFKVQETGEEGKLEIDYKEFWDNRRFIPE
jgi:hypothetical protein